MKHGPTSKSAGDTSKVIIGAVAVLWGVFFVLGTVQFKEHYPDLLDAGFHSLQLFHLHFPEHIQSVGPALEIARWGAGLLGLAVIPMVLGLLFGDHIFRYWVRLAWNNHIIVCGHSAATMSLIRDLHRVKYKVVFIGHFSHSSAELPHGVLYLEGDAQNCNLLQMARAHRAAHLVAMNEDDRENIEVLVVATRLCGSRRKNPQPLHCHAHLQDTYLQAALYRTLGQTLADSARVRYHLFNSYEIVARLLACRYPLPQALVEEAPLPEHYIIVGFGAFGRNVALKLVKMGQQLVHPRAPSVEGEWQIVKPCITVVDPNGDTATAAFLNAYPAFRNHCDFAVMKASCDSPDFLALSFLKIEKASLKTSVIICMEDETASLRTAMLLLELSGASEHGIGAIYLRLAKPERINPILAGIPKQPRLVFFAPDSEVFSADAILSKSLDILARAVHEAYLQVAQADRRTGNQSPAADKTWDQLSEHERDGNREAADHTWAKLRTLGYDLHRVPGAESVPQHDPVFLAELRGREEELARVEHYRWMTWRLLDGWQYGKERNPVLKRHPDIVPYEHLAKPTQEKDKAIIRALPKLLNAGCLRITRIDSSSP